MNDDANGALKNLGIFSALQAATEVKFFLLSASFVLMVDNALLFLKQPGIFELATDKLLFENTNLVLKIILLFVAFSFLTSLILPMLAIIFDWILIETIGRGAAAINIYLDNRFRNNHVRARDVDCVTPRELKIAAHTTRDKYLLDLYKDYEADWWEERKHTFQFAMYSFYALTMLCINFYMGHMFHPSASLVLANFFGSTEPIWGAIILLIVTMSYRFIRRTEQEWIYCPILYKELQEAKRQQILPG